MQKLLDAKGHSFTTPTELDCVKEMKEKLCYIATDYEEACKEAAESKSCEKSYELPDGRKVMVGDERFKAPEILFDPSICGKTHMEGLHKYTYDSIMKSDQDIRKELYENIILSGGSTLFENFGERLYTGLASLASPATRIKIT
jgi:actin